MGGSPRCNAADHATMRLGRCECRAKDCPISFNTSGSWVNAWPTGAAAEKAVFLLSYCLQDITSDNVDLLDGVALIPLEDQSLGCLSN